MTHLSLRDRNTTALLACVLGASQDNDHAAQSSFFHWCNHLLVQEWERAERPFIFVASPWEFRPRAKEDFAGWLRPNPGHLVFRPALPSLLRDTRFRSFFSDLGKPPLIFIGAYLDEIILATAVDGFLSGHSIVVVREATYVQSYPIAMHSQLRDATLTILSRFAKIVDREDIFND